MKTTLKIRLLFGICSVLFSNFAFAQSSARDLMDMASATMDAIRETREQSSSPDAVKAVFARAKAAEEDGNINFCGFFTGMSEAEANVLISHYGLKTDEYGVLSMPGSGEVYKFDFSLRGVRRITKGGNSFDELSQAVANRVGTMKSVYDDNYDLKYYEYKTIDGVCARISESCGFVLLDLPREKKEKDRLARIEAERRAEAARIEAERRAEAARIKAERRAEAARPAVQELLGQMVDIPGKNYKMCKYEVTQALWEAIMGDNPSEFKGPDRPVEYVSWDDCQEFLEKLNANPEVKKTGLKFRLPTEEEWEYACRAGSTGDYCKISGGTEITMHDLGTVAWFSDNSNFKTHPVGQKQPNAFGLYDMHGNVAEWTSTAGGDSTLGRVYRDGSYGHRHWSCTCGDWSWSYPDNRKNTLGFRLVASAGL